jgi:hypothetical protein
MFLPRKIPEEFHSELKKGLFGTHSKLIWDACELLGMYWGGNAEINGIF